MKTVQQNEHFTKNCVVKSLMQKCGRQKSKSKYLSKIKTKLSKMYTKIK